MDSRPQNRVELARFLRTRREALSPDELGLPSGTRRRTPGLRRDEVALLASMSTSYYERLEQARAPQPSPTVLSAIARSLRLTTEERQHLYLLAGQPSPLSPAARSRDLDAALVAAMESLTPTTVALIVDDLGTVLSENQLSTQVFGHLSDRANSAGYAGNMVWRWFTDPAWRASWAPVGARDTITDGLVADLRAMVTPHGHDDATTRFVNRLRAASEEFARHWDQHRVSRLQPSFEVLEHPRVGTLTMECGILQGAAPGQRLFLFRPAPGTPTDGRLAALARPGSAGATGS